MIKLISLFFMCFFTSCTMSVTTVHTQGRADDVVDEQQEASPTISPDIKIPVGPLAS